MIDFTKGKLINRDLMLNNFEKEKDKHLVIGKYDYSNNREVYTRWSRRENMEIKITEKGATIENSLHKYFNKTVHNKSHNYNDFKFCDVLFALDTLEQDIKYPLNKVILTNLEFGFNIELGRCPTEFLDKHLLMHDLKYPCYNPKNDKDKKIKKFIYSEYLIKIYNKTLDQSRFKNLKDELVGTNILRIEVKYTSKRLLNKFGIYNLSDLKNPAVYKMLLVDFLKKFEPLLIIDSYNGISSMSRGDRNYISLCTNPNYWIDLRSKSKSPNTVTNHKKKLKAFIKKHGLDTSKNKLKNSIIAKFDELLVLDCYDNSISLLNAA